MRIKVLTTNGFLVLIGLLFAFPFGAYAANRISLYDALSYTLVNESTIKLQKQEINYQKGNYQYTAGQFDTAFSASAGIDRSKVPLLSYEQTAYSNRIKEDDSTTSAYQMGLTKKFKNGVVIGPEVNLSRLNSNTRDISGYKTENRSAIEFAIMVPLFKGSTPGLSEDAAKIEYEKSLYDLENTVANSIYSTATNYWDVVGQKEAVEILQSGENRAKKLVEYTEKLAKADEIPKSDVESAIANLAQRKAVKISAQTDLDLVKANLITAMGLNDSDSQILATTRFPKIDYKKIKRYSNSKKYIALAMRQRKDIKALEYYLRSQDLLKQSAKTDLKPSLDLSVSAGYAGLNEGASTIAALGKNIAGPSIAAEINYKFPLANREAKGTLLARTANYDKALINLKNLKRTIKINVRLITLSLEKIGLQMQASERSVHYYQTSLSNEMKKLKHGESTILNVINIEDQLRDAELRKTFVRLAYAKTLLDLQHQTGSLVEQHKENYKVSVAKIL